MKRVRPSGESFVEDAVLAYPVDAASDVVHPHRHELLADRTGAVGGLVAEEDVWVVGVRPPDATVAEPAAEYPMAEVAESLPAAGEGDSPVSQVEVVERQVADGAGAGGVLGGQGDDDSSGEVIGLLLDGPNLLIGHWEQGEVGRAALQPGLRVGEDQAALLGESEERPQGAGRGGAL
ncbi:hypothetical protein [Nonomuraea lactucae]|uniref:hypothetical protein n=1 Tax=Nonomuraea lactucae TaxID=2249762 RepID=UPI0013B3894E|nr:hypothetical protein [Nonomuraea lactucae]